MQKICPSCKQTYEGGEVFCPNDATRLITPSQADTEPLHDPDDPLVGTELAGRYRVIRQIGEGGMGLVYEAMHSLIEKRVAIKLLRKDFSSRPEVVTRFRQEAKSASRIGHAHIVDISDFGETPDGSSYFVMEYLEGEDLANVLHREAMLEVERAVNIVLQCCKALGAAHSKGIVHRDMKPENIFLTTREDRPDFVKIVDFGIAKMSDIETDGAPGRKLTKTGMIFGTPEYMSPEQAAGKELDHRVDIYALGVILYELVTGRVPFVGDSFMGILTQHMFEEPPPLRDVHPTLKIRAELETVIFKALAKESEARFQSMDQFHEALELAMEGRASPTLLGFGEPVKARSTKSRRRPLAVSAADESGPLGARKSRMPLLVGLLALAGLGGVLGWALTGTEESVTPLEPTAGPPGDEEAPPATVVAAAAQHTDVADTAAGETRPGETVPGEMVPVDAVPEAVPVTVTTMPSGAEVEVDGDVEGCSPTPCTVQAPPGETLRIRARRGRSVGTAELTPTTATTVQVALVPRRSRGRSTSTMSSMRATRSDGPMDLKVPDIFR